MLVDSTASQDAFCWHHSLVWHLFKATNIEISLDFDAILLVVTNHLNLWSDCFPTWPIDHPHILGNLLLYALYHSSQLMIYKVTEDKASAPDGTSHNTPDRTWDYKKGSQLLTFLLVSGEYGLLQQMWMLCNLATAFSVQIVWLETSKHQFHETCHSVTFIVLVNSHQRWTHQRWKQTRNRICFHLWCELTLAL